MLVHFHASMEELDIPIFKKAYELYKTFHGIRNLVPKADRHTLWQRSENVLLEIIEFILLASQLPKAEKLSALERASMKLNLLRMLLRLARDTKAIDLKKSVSIQQIVDEIGRMLGGWIKSVKSADTRAPPQRSF
ncbi:diversity-generating retroelement protein Avd [Candidatus Peregrinibacteria bacterium]|nr:diversity-generating retroelement protein Avd [Candidatus Peregrinibacteria bacterium]MBI3816100.1 diversity-generating retroelement protein Avd [Candidatus Peregrinibacteria bacterium]